MGRLVYLILGVTIVVILIRVIVAAIQSFG